MNGLIIGFIITTILLATSSVGLGLIINYPYLDPLSHQLRETCIMTNCVIGDIAYCGRSSCVYYHYDYTLMYNETNYTKTFYGTTSDMKTCSNFYYIDCYYDNREVIGSFTVTNDSSSIIGIVFMTFLVLLLLVLFIILKTKLIITCLDMREVIYV